MLVRMHTAPVLEAIVLYLQGERVHHLHRGGDPTLRLEWQAGLHPAEVVVDGAAAVGLSPFLVHSTSWRMEGDHLILSFLVGVEAPESVPTGFAQEPVGRVDLARGHAMGPPADVEPYHVVEHGLRHLAWLVRDDPGIREALPGWAEALEAYEPEPFRAFG